MMTFGNFCVVILIVNCFGILLTAAQLYEGSACQLKDESWAVCKAYPKCNWALNEMKSGKLKREDIVRCSFQGATIIICCGDEIPTTTKSEYTADIDDEDDIIFKPPRHRNIMFFFPNTFKPIRNHFKKKIDKIEQIKSDFSQKITEYNPFSNFFAVPSPSPVIPFTTTTSKTTTSTTTMQTTTTTIPIDTTVQNRTREPKQFEKLVEEPSVIVPFDMNMYNRRVLEIFITNVTGIWLNESPSSSSFVPISSSTSRTTTTTTTTVKTTTLTPSKPNYIYTNDDEPIWSFGNDITEVPSNNNNNNVINPTVIRIPTTATTTTTTTTNRPSTVPTTKTTVPTIQTTTELPSTTISSPIIPTTEDYSYLFINNDNNTNLNNNNSDVIRTTDNDWLLAILSEYVTPANVINSTIVSPTSVRTVDTTTRRTTTLPPTAAINDNRNVIGVDRGANQRPNDSDNIITPTKKPDIPGPTPPGTRSGQRKSEIACNNYTNIYTQLSFHILNGEETEPGEFPHMAAIGYTSSGGENPYDFRCGGSLITERYVLTAAHCTAAREVPVVVRLGVIDLSVSEDPPQDIIIETIVNHPMYRSNRNYHDIALILLSKPSVFNDNVKPACLQTNSEDPPPNQVLVVTGWGVTTLEKRERSLRLLKTNLTAVAMRECNTTYTTQVTRDRKLPSGLDSGQLCAHGVDSRSDACEGDSGGPLQITSESRLSIVVGITSFGIVCGTSVPGVYARVSHYLNWIESVVWP